METRTPPGFRIRNATLDDVVAAARVAAACDEADVGDHEMSEDFLHDEWVRRGFDPSTDAWIVTGPAGDVVAFAHTWAEEPFVFDTEGYVHPAWRGHGLGTMLVTRVEDRAIRDRAQVPAGSAIRILQSFDADASGARDPDASGARALFEGLGYAPHKEYLHMEIEVPDGLEAGAMPTGIVVRPRVETDDPDLVAVMADAFQDPWDYDEARQEWASSRTYDPSLWLIARDGEQAVGALFASRSTVAARSAPSASATAGGAEASRKPCSGDPSPASANEG